MKRGLFATVTPLSRSALVTAQSTRSLSTSEPLVNVELFEDKRTAQVSLSSSPVNSLSLEMLEAITAAVQSVEASDVRGFVLASEMSSVFSAGLQITEMYQPDEARLRAFWAALQDTWLTLYGSPLASVAAIDGHAPAGGCLLASCCDERVMARGKFGIGLNETQLGIVAPFWFVGTLDPLIGVRASSRMLQLGTLYQPDAALDLGLVDRLEDHGTVVAAAHEILSRYVRIDPAARHASKMIHRAPLIEKLRARKQFDIDSFVEFAMTDKVQGTIGAYLESLKNRKK